MPDFGRNVTLETGWVVVKVSVARFHPPSVVQPTGLAVTTWLGVPSAYTSVSRSTGEVAPPATQRIDAPAVRTVPAGRESEIVWYRPAELVELATKNAPAGSEPAVSMIKSAVAAANNAYDTFAKAAKQAVDSVESNFAAATQASLKAAAAANDVVKAKGGRKAA